MRGLSPLVVSVVRSDQNGETEQPAKLDYLTFSIDTGYVSGSGLTGEVLLKSDRTSLNLQNFTRKEALGVALAKVATSTGSAVLGPAIISSVLPDRTKWVDIPLTMCSADGFQLPSVPRERYRLADEKAGSLWNNNTQVRECTWWGSVTAVSVTILP
jgi:hypothetical protein